MDVVLMPFDLRSMNAQFKDAIISEAQDRSDKSKSSTPSTNLSEAPGRRCSREETIKSLHEARRKKRREQNKAAQRKFRQKREQAETELRSHIDDAQKEVEELQKDNSRLAKELSIVRNENNLWRVKQKEESPVKKEMTELDAVSKRLTRSMAGLKEQRPTSSSKIVATRNDDDALQRISH